MKTSTDKKKQTCMYVIADNEAGKWSINEHFKKLNGVYDGIGWYIPLQYKAEVEEICNQASLVHFEQPLEAESFDALKASNKLNYYKKRAAEVESQIHKLAAENNIEFTDIHNLSKTKSGDELLQLTDQYQNWQKKMACIENKKLIEGIPLPQTVDEPSEDLFSYLLESNSEEKLIEELKSISDGVDTGYTIGKIALKFAGGVISIIAAPTSHGKTSALINFALGALEKNIEKSVYFFTYEESRASILSLFMNTYINQNLSRNNRESIISYFRNGSSQYFTTGMFEVFLPAKEEFFSNLIDNGRLKISYSDMPAEDLIQAIFYLKSNTDVGMICIDYMQLLKLRKVTTSSRQEELKQICLILKDCAVKTGLPIVLTAQFNRTVVTEADLSPVNIGEAGDIERIASLIIGMFNRNFVLNRDGNKNKNGDSVDKEPTIYFEVLKGRGIGNGHNTVMDFNGNTGKLIKRESIPDGFENMKTKSMKASSQREIIF